VAAPIFALLNAILSHLYSAHFDAIVSLGLVGYLNALFVHFAAFAAEFHLITENDLMPLQYLIQSLLRINSLG